MKKLFNTNFNHQNLNFALLLLRIGIACFMLTHGLQKLNTFLAGGEIQFADPIGIGVKLSFFLALFAEVFCSVLILFGLAIRLAVLPLIINMMVAVFIVHVPDGFIKQELGSHYLLVYVFLLFSGSGKYSLDYLISRKPNRRR